MVLVSRRRRSFRRPGSPAHRSASPGGPRGTAAAPPSEADFPFSIRSPSLRGELDCVVAVEHCWGCEAHASCCWHDPGRYAQHANVCVAAVCEALLLHRVPVRLVAYKTRAREGDSARLGALEVSVGLRVAVAADKDQGAETLSAADPAVRAISFAHAASAAPPATASLEWRSALLHSKLKTGCWPNVVALRHAAAAFVVDALRAAGYAVPEPVPTPTPTPTVAPTTATKGTQRQGLEDPAEAGHKRFVFLEEESDDEGGATAGGGDGRRRDQRPSLGSLASADTQGSGSAAAIRRAQSMYGTASGTNSPGSPHTPSHTPTQSHAKTLAAPAAPAAPVLSERARGAYEAWLARMKFASKEPRDAAAEAADTLALAQSAPAHAQAPAPSASQDTLHRKRSTFSGPSAFWPPHPLAKHTPTARKRGVDDEASTSGGGNVLAAALALDRARAEVGLRPKGAHEASEPPPRAYGYRRGTFFGYPRGLAPPPPPAPVDAVEPSPSPAPGAASALSAGGHRKYSSTNTLPKMLPPGRRGSPGPATTGKGDADGPGGKGTEQMSDYELFESLVIKHFLVFDERPSKPPPPAHAFGRPHSNHTTPKRL